MIRISDIKLGLKEPISVLKSEAAKRLRIKEGEINSLVIRKRSLDARKKNEIKYIYTVDVSLNKNEDMALKRCSKDKSVSKAVSLDYIFPENKKFGKRPVIVGFGPAGMFAAYILAKCGACPLVIERGGSVEDRSKSVETFHNTRILDTDSNIQFGVGGAGTFSDGKLNTGIKDPRIAMVLRTFAEHGAPEEILYDAKPHIGTDKLPNTVKNIRNEIISLGGTVLFNTKVVDFIIKDNAIAGVKYREKNGHEETVETDHLILAIGHSARDTFKRIHELGIPVEPKSFSVGARIEHKAEMINLSQYGVTCKESGLRTADYKLSAHLQSGRGVYTFCMCPGGTVVGATSLEGHVVTNGMSTFARDGENSNSAVLVGISPADYGSDDPLAGMYFQEKIEKEAFILGGGNYNAPAQRYEDLVANRATKAFGDIRPTYLPGVTPTNIRDILPDFVGESLAEGIKEMGKRLKGFDHPDAVLTAPETRSSSPIRIMRGEDLVSIKIKGLYPCGEGAGYAGGITSAAVDGIRCAEAVLRSK